MAALFQSVANPGGAGERPCPPDHPPARGARLRSCNYRPYRPCVGSRGDPAPLQGGAAPDAGSAYNLAITYRNGGDLLNYRRALAHAARGDVEAAEELRRFR